MERIAALISPIPIRTADELGVPPAAREAMAFAVLADMTLPRNSRMFAPVAQEQPRPSCSVSSRSLRIPLCSIQFRTQPSTIY